MRIISLTSAGLLAVSIATGASAADLSSPSPSPVFVQSASSWTGYYVGAHAGVLFGSTGLSRAYAGANAAAVQGPGYNAPASSRLNGSGGLFGVQVGYNHQVSSQIVLGVEGSLAITGNRRSLYKTSTGTSFFGNDTTHDMRYFATLRARAGFLMTPQFLVYATGGLAMANVAVRDSVNYVAGGVTPTTGAGNATRLGLVVGAGAEYQMSRNWSVKLEYLYYSLAKTTVFNPGFGPGFQVSYTTSFKTEGSMVNLGVNYRF